MKKPVLKKKNAPARKAPKSYKAAGANVKESRIGNRGK